MEISRTDAGGETTLKLSGCLDTTASAQFAEALAGLANATSLVLDMTELEFISSSALRVLVSTKKRRGAAFKIALTGLNDVVREVFDVTGLDEVFEVRG